MLVMLDQYGERRRATMGQNLGITGLRPKAKEGIVTQSHIAGVGMLFFLDSTGHDTTAAILHMACVAQKRHSSRQFTWAFNCIFWRLAWAGLRGKAWGKDEIKRLVAKTIKTGSA